MKINTTSSKSRKKAIIIATSAVLLILIAAVLFYFFTRPQGSSLTTQNPNQQKTTQNQSDNASGTSPKSDSQQKQDFLDSQKDPSSNPPTGAGGSDTISEKDISFSTSESGNSVIVLTNLGDTPSGTCKLTVKNNEKSITQTASVMYAHPYSSCEGFTVQKNSLGSGQWSISLSVTSNGTSATTSKDIKVQ